jgi:hypothetical protein
MADVPILVAVISASAGVAGALASPVAIAFREGHQAKRDRQDRKTTDRQQAYLDLLGTAAQLRTQVANYYEHKGDGLYDRLAVVRELAAEAGLNAVRVRLLASDPIGTLAESLAVAANGLAERTDKDTDRTLGAVNSDGPDYKRLDECREAFRQAVTAAEEAS